MKPTTTITSPIPPKVGITPDKSKSLIDGHRHAEHEQNELRAMTGVLDIRLKAMFNKHRDSYIALKQKLQRCALSEHWNEIVALIPRIDAAKSSMTDYAKLCGMSIQYSHSGQFIIDCELVDLMAETDEVTPTMTEIPDWLRPGFEQMIDDRIKMNAGGNMNIPLAEQIPGGDLHIPSGGMPQAEQIPGGEMTPAPDSKVLEHAHA